MAACLRLCLSTFTTCLLSPISNRSFSFSFSTHILLSFYSESIMLLLFTPWLLSLWGSPLTHPALRSRSGKADRSPKSCALEVGKVMLVGGVLLCTPAGAPVWGGPGAEGLRKEVGEMMQVESIQQSVLKEINFIMSKFATFTLCYIVLTLLSFADLVYRWIQSLNINTQHLLCCDGGKTVLYGDK